MKLFAKRHFVKIAITVVCAATSLTLSAQISDISEPSHSFSLTRHLGELQTSLAMNAPLSPEAGELRLAIAELYLTVGREEEADISLVGALRAFEESGESGRALEVMRIRNTLGQLKSEVDIMRLVQALKHTGLPTQAAQRLQQAMLAGDVPRTATHTFNLMDLWLASRHPEQAEKAYKTFLPDVFVQTEQSLRLMTQLGESYIFDQRCEEAQKIMQRLTYPSQVKAELSIGVTECYLKKATHRARSPYQCDWVPERGFSFVSENYEKALESFETITLSDVQTPNGTKKIESSLKYLASIRTKCETSGYPWPGVAGDRCYLDIAKAYENQAASDDELKLSDPACIFFKDRYDLEYRPTPNPQP